VSAFQAAYKLPSVTVDVLGPNSGGYFGEASLDTQYITASGRGVRTWFLSQEAFDMVRERERRAGGGVIRMCVCVCVCG
jgi:hypothetical protein